MLFLKLNIDSLLVYIYLKFSCKPRSFPREVTRLWQFYQVIETYYDIYIYIKILILTVRSATVLRILVMRRVHN